MTFREMSRSVFEPAAIFLMVFGIIATCQPWSAMLHSYGILITLAGLVGYSIFSKIQPESD